MPTQPLRKENLLNTPSAIWRAITNAGGLDLRYHSDMDEDIVQSLLRALGATPSTKVSNALRNPDLAVEEFIGALLEALNPFSKMLSDLLSMFERAGARRTDHSLRIDFDFGNAPKLSFDLRQFRDWIEAVRRVRELVSVRHWSLEGLWTLSSLLQTHDNQILRTDAEPWELEYREMRRWPDFPLPTPVSGDAALDDALRKCFKVWSTVVRESTKFGHRRDELRERARAEVAAQEVESAWPANFLYGLDSDHWAGSVAANMHRLALKTRFMPEPERRAFADEHARRIEDFFSQVPASTVEEESIGRVLIEFLNLPIWQRRHELYSAWVMTLIADALSGHDLRFHVEEGLLSFSFGGSHLATAEALQPHLHVWAELRSPLDEPSLLSGRRNIQPDYTLVADPVTSSKSAVAVVECKQYRRFSKRNFSHAVIDYANGRSNAAIILAAYGPVRDDFLAALTPQVSRRITLIGHLRPNDEGGRERFQLSLRAALAGRYAATPADLPMPPPIPIARHGVAALKSVRLSWRAKPQDLDLHLNVWHAGRWANIDYHSHGSTSGFPWGMLDRDVTSGYGPETITISKVLAATYRCYVHNYSGDVPLANCGAEVVVSYRDSELHITCPRAGTGRFWHVFDFAAELEALNIVNAITDADPAAIEMSPDSASRVLR